MIRIRNNPAPLLLPMLAAVSGIACGRILRNAGLNPVLYAGAGTVLVSLVFFFIFRKRKIALAFLLTAVALLFRADYEHRTTPGPGNICQILPFEGTVTGRVLLPARMLVIAVERGNGMEFSGKVLIRWKGENPPPGSTVEIKGKFYKPFAPVNPGQFNWRGYLENRSIFTEGKADSVKVVDKGLFASVLGETRKYIKDKIYKYFPEKEASILAGMMLGEPGELTKETLEHFRKAGIMHVLAVSGLHVGLVLFSIYYVLSATGLGRNKSLIISMGFMLVYVMVSGARPSAVRAAVMLSMAVTGDILGGRGNIFNSLCLAALLILGVNPGLLFTSGFLLSFLAVWGIAYISPSLSKYTGRPLAASFSAVAAILPVLGWNFYYLPLIAPITNLLVVPLASIAISLTLFFLAVAGISGFLARIYSASIGLVIKIIEYISAFVYHTGIGGIDWVRPSVITITGFYLILISLGLRKTRNRTLFIIISTTVFLSGAFGDKYLRKNFIAAIKSGNSFSWVIRQGSDTILLVGKKDPDQRALTSFLYSKGIRNINHIYLIHPPFDTMENTAEIARRFNAQKVFYPGVYGNRLNWQKFKELLGQIDIQAAKKGDRINCRKFYVEITEPDRKYLDIRDNVIQAEITGRRKLFIYAGGNIPKHSFDIIIALSPYKPAWDTLKTRARENIIYSGTEQAPDGVIHLNQAGFTYLL